MLSLISQLLFNKELIFVSRVSLNPITNGFIESKTQMFLCSVLVSLHSVRSVCQRSGNTGRQFLVAVKFL